MTDGLRKSLLRKAPQVGLSEVGLPEGNPGMTSYKKWRPDPSKVQSCVRGRAHIT